jgi:hypothetical protein
MANENTRTESKEMGKLEIFANSALVPITLGAVELAIRKYSGQNSPFLVLPFVEALGVGSLAGLFGGMTGITGDTDLSYCSLNIAWGSLVGAGLIEAASKYLF